MLKVSYKGEIKMAHNVENETFLTLTLTPRQAEILKEIVDSTKAKENYEVFNFRKVLSNAIETQLEAKNENLR
jgi:hypothetical protein